MTFTACPSELRDHYLSERVVPFVGAGVSMSVGWTQGGVQKSGPSWAELVNQAALKLDFKDPELLRVRGTDLQILEYFKLKNSGQFASLTNWLYSEMRPPDADLAKSRIHRELANLSKCRIFYTTNYDDFLERSFGLHKRPVRTIAVEADIAGPLSAPGTCEIVKFHGDLDHPDKMVLSESHYEKRLTLASEMDYRLRSDMLGRVLLFLGYSFRDWNVSYIFRLINDIFHELPSSITGRRAFITVPDPSDFEFQLFRARNIEVIPVDGKDQAASISFLLSDMRR
jgi:NAD-dependent SIR2 family protein deacetylase